MNPGEIINRALSSFKETWLYWPVEQIQNILKHLPETRENWDKRPLCLRPKAVIGLFSVLLLRASASHFEPAIRNRMRTPDDPDIPNSERRLAVYSAVMGAFRIDVVAKKSQFSLSDPLAIQSYFALAGISTLESDGRTGPPAMARSRPEIGELPEVIVNPSSPESVNRNHDLSHELFHMASPFGEHLHKDGHPREVFANRFAVDVTHPAPWVIYCAEEDAARLLENPFAFEEVMRISSRPMFGITLLADDDVQKGSIVLQAREDQAQCEDRELTRLAHSWDELLLSIESEEMDEYLKRFTWKPKLIPTGGNGLIHLQTLKGLYYSRKCTNDVWSMFAESGIMEPSDSARRVPGLPRFSLRDIPELEPDVDHRVVVEGGQYLTIQFPRDVGSLYKHRSPKVYQLFAIKDEDGYLYQCWEHAVSGRKPRWGPLLPPLDTQRHEHLVPFDNWWLANREWREITFDNWAQMLANKFMRDAKVYQVIEDKVEMPR